MGAMNEKILKVRNVAKAFDGREMIHGMNLSVERGMIYGLLGVNGAGKTTTFKMITGLLLGVLGCLKHGESSGDLWTLC